MNATVTHSPRDVGEWREALAQGTILPAFQPILSVETQMIFGYEILGRLQTEGGLVSLGPFFQSEDADSSLSSPLRVLKREVDRELRRTALTFFARDPNPHSCLFLNIAPSQMLAHLNEFPDDLPFTLKLIEESGIDPRRIVIEITEEAVEQDLESLKNIIEVYRKRGCRIAVDDVGAESSNLDRIGLFHPDFIKLDFSMLGRSMKDRSFQEILVNLSRIGESLGSALLFEGVETEEELDQALRYGGRFIQGYFFAAASPFTLREDSFADLMRKCIENFCLQRTKLIHDQVRWEQDKLLWLVDLSFGLKERDGLVLLDPEDLGVMKDFAYRLYFTDRHGYQISPNYTNNPDASWLTDFSTVGRNWCSRPYFFDHMYKSHGRPGGWNISEVYQDVHQKVLLRTFSRFVTAKSILFIDVLLTK